MLDRLIKYLIITSAIASAIIFAGFSCAPRNVQTPEPSSSESTAQTENLEPGEALDWSTVTPEDLWQGVFELYDTEGPKFALALLDKAISNNVVTFQEADQVRAGFLYELGRLDEAFLRLSSYIIDVNRPDLLRLRGEVLWGMGRYDEALRDYLTLYDSDPDNASPEILLAINRLYNTLAEWDKASEFRGKLESSDSEGAMVMALDLYDALQSEDPVKIRNLIPALTQNAGAESGNDPSVVLATVYAEYLEGNKTRAAQDALDYITNYGFDSNIGLILLKLNVETGDFESFTSNLRTMLTQLNAIQWLDALPDTYPQPVDQPMTVGSLLDSASAIELGSVRRVRPRLIANRSLIQKPYDYIAYLQLAAVDKVDKNISSEFINLNQALALAPPSDVRTR
ncbi:MAG: hypothetical protein NTY09_14115, partial [bacterium]|nr:hypothetical protein [bacterium]